MTTALHIISAGLAAICGGFLVSVTILFIGWLKGNPK